jgi:hypothetical protein
MIIVSRESVQEYVNSHTPDQVKRYVGRACVVLFNLQTESEKDINATNVDNGVGFTGADAYSGSLTAKTFLKRGTLDDWQCDRWLKENVNGVPRIAKYWKQLDGAAQQRRQQQERRHAAA